MYGLLTKAASPDILNSAWKRSSRDKALWRPGLPRREMERDMAYHLVAMAEQLRDGSYTPDPVRYFSVSKGDGKQRIISASTLRDKVAQRAVLSVIEPIGEALFHQDSFGYRPGRTIEMALSRVREYMLCGLNWIVNADIKECFDNIPHKQLLKAVRRIIKDDKAVTLIEKWLNAGTVKRGFISGPRGLPQGAVLSPFLCNLYLTGLDNVLSSKNFAFVRFADDFIIFCETEKKANISYECAEKTLKGLGMSLNSKKTRITVAGPNIRFLGRKLPKLKRVIKCSKENRL